MYLRTSPCSLSLLPATAASNSAVWGYLLLELRQRVIYRAMSIRTPTGLARNNSRRKPARCSNPSHSSPAGQQITRFVETLDSPHLRHCERKRSSLRRRRFRGANAEEKIGLL